MDLFGMVHVCAPFITPTINAYLSAYILIKIVNMYLTKLLRENSEYYPYLNHFSTVIALPDSQKEEFSCSSTSPVNIC